MRSLASPDEHPLSHPHHRPIAKVVLEDAVLDRLPAILARDVEQAVADLSQGRFEPAGLEGPFILRLSVQNGRLVFDVRDGDDKPLRLIGVALGPFRRLIKDYMLVAESHVLAVAEGRMQRLEAIDMGRRGLHNEGAAQMVERLRGKISVDEDTAGRLFTLVCVLQQR